MVDGTKALLCMLALVSSGCVGTVGGGGEEEEQQERTKVAFQTLLGDPGDKGNPDAPAPPPSTPSPTPEPDTIPDLADTANVLVATVSRCHASEYEHIVKTQQPFINPGTGDYDKKLIVTLETATTALGYAEVHPSALKIPQQDLNKDVVHKRTYPLTLRVPADVIASGEFTAYLFACIDLDGDKSCVDEGAGPMEGFDFSSDVVYFIPVKARLESGRLAYRRLTPGEIVQGPSSAAQKMKNLLNNLQASDIGLNDGNPLSMVLTVRATRAKACGWGVRTNGCFVAGTRVQLAGGETALVEELPAGSAMLTAAGTRVRSVRAVAGPEQHPVVNIVTAGGQRLTVTRLHPLMTAAGLKLAEDLTPDDRLLTAAWQPVRIESLRRTRYRGMVYNFELPGTKDQQHLLVAEGLITGDLYLQQKLSASRGPR